MRREVLSDVGWACIEGLIFVAGGMLSGFVGYGDITRPSLLYVFAVAVTLSYRRLALARTVNRTVIEIRRIITEPRR